MYRVLLPVDSSEARGAAQADMVARLAAEMESVEATLVHVFDSDNDRAETTSVTQIAGGNAAADRLSETNVTVRTASRKGDPAAEILDAATELDVDLVVLGGRKRSPLGSLLFGSVTQAVILDADRPVTVTGGET